MEQEKTSSVEKPKIFRSVKVNIHPLKDNLTTKQSKKRKRTRKPDKVDPFSQTIDNYVDVPLLKTDTPAGGTPAKTEENSFISPPKKMRLRSATKKKPTKTLISGTRKKFPLLE